VARKKG